MLSKGQVSKGAGCQVSQHEAPLVTCARGLGSTQKVVYIKVTKKERSCVKEFTLVHLLTARLHPSCQSERQLARCNY